MTYTEIKEKYWNLDSIEARKEFIQSLPEATQTAWKVIELLEDRKGFEYWWNPNASGGMARECNDDIFAELTDLLS